MVLSHHLSDFHNWGKINNQHIQWKQSDMNFEMRIHAHTLSRLREFLLDTKSQKQISKLWYNSQGLERFNLYNCSSNHTFIIEAKIEKQKRARER